MTCKARNGNRRRVSGCGEIPKQLARHLRSQTSRHRCRTPSRVDIAPLSATARRYLLLWSENVGSGRLYLQTWYLGLAYD